MTRFFSKLTLTNRGIQSRIKSLSNDSYDIHKEIWGLFPGSPDSHRDFIYSVMDDGRTVFIVSEREPIMNDHWSVETKPYDPAIHSGDVFRFRLLANPTVMKSSGGHHSRHDVVMDLKRKYRAEGRTVPMDEIIYNSVSEWTIRKASIHGFEVDPNTLMIHSYDRTQSKKGDMIITISTVVIEGTLLVKDVESFKKTLYEGIGTAKGFGCGMLMIKRS